MTITAAVSPVLDAREDIEPVAVGQLEVEENQVVVSALDGGPCVPAVLCDVDVEALTGERYLHQFRDGLVVLDDEHRSSGSRLLGTLEIQSDLSPFPDVSPLDGKPDVKATRR